MPTQLVITRSAMPVASISSASKHDSGRVIVSPVRPWRSTSISSAIGVRAWLVPPTPITASFGTSRRTASAAVVSLSLGGPAEPLELRACGLDAGRGQPRAHAAPTMAAEQRQDLGGAPLHLLGVVLVRDQADLLHAGVEVRRDLLGAVLRGPADGAVGCRAAPLRGVEVRRQPRAAAGLGPPPSRSRCRSAAG